MTKFFRVVFAVVAVLSGLEMLRTFLLFATENVDFGLDVAWYMLLLMTGMIGLVLADIRDSLTTSKARQSRTIRRLSAAAYSATAGVHGFAVAFLETSKAGAR